MSGLSIEGNFFKQGENVSDGLCEDQSFKFYSYIAPCCQVLSEKVFEKNYRWTNGLIVRLISIMKDVREELLSQSRYQENSLNCVDGLLPVNYGGYYKIVAERFNEGLATSFRKSASSCRHIYDVYFSPLYDHSEWTSIEKQLFFSIIPHVPKNGYKFDWKEVAKKLQLIM